MSVTVDSVAEYANLYDGLYDQLLAKLNAGLQNEPPINAAHHQLYTIFKMMFPKLVDNNLTNGREVQIDDYKDLFKSIKKLRVVLAENVADIPNALLMMHQFPWVDLLVTAWRNWRIEVNGVAPTAEVIYNSLMGINGVGGALEKICVVCGAWQGRLEINQIADLLMTDAKKYKACVKAARQDFAQTNGLQPIDYESGRVVWPTLKQMERMLSEGIEKIDKNGGVLTMKIV